MNTIKLINEYGAGFASIFQNGIFIKTSWYCH